MSNQAPYRPRFSLHYQHHSSEYSGPPPSQYLPYPSDYPPFPLPPDVSPLPPHYPPTYHHSRPQIHDHKTDSKPYQAQGRSKRRYPYHRGRGAKRERHHHDSEYDERLYSQSILEDPWRGLLSVEEDKAHRDRIARRFQPKLAPSVATTIVEASVNDSETNDDKIIHEKSNTMDNSQKTSLGSDSSNMEQINE